MDFNAEDGRNGRWSWYFHNGRNLEPRGPGQVGYKSLSVEATLANPAELCGIYESGGAEETRSDQPNNVVLYVGGTCAHRKPHKVRSRIIGYYKYGNHKKDLIYEALAKGYDLWARVNLL